MKDKLFFRGCVARDKDGKLWFHNRMPHKCEESWRADYGSRYFISEEDDIFGDDVRWEDKEPLIFKFGMDIEYEAPVRKKKREEQDKL